MPYQAKILADSISEAGVRLTTMEWTYPRAIHAELMTHRMLSRNAASSRAIPARKLRAMVEEEPFIPLSWLAEQPGMVGGPSLTGGDAEAAERIWLRAGDHAVACSELLSDLGVHKSLANRLIEPFTWITVLITATEWENLFHLRVAPDAEQHFNHVASMAQDAYRAGEPALLKYGEWHLPLINPSDREYPPSTLVKLSVGRCARVSYLTHDGVRDPSADIALHDRLLESRHMSPFEHVATPWTPSTSWSGNLRGWQQYRKMIPGENYIGPVSEERSR